MPLLLVTILMAAAINLGFSEAEKCGMNGLRVVWHNYVAATFLSISVLLFQGIPTGSLHITAMLSQTPDGMFTYCIIMGVITGVIYLATFLINQRSIVLCGPSLTVLVSKLGVMILVLFASFLWKEPVSLFCYVGIFLACIALFLFHEEHLSFSWILPIVFFFGGISELVKKFFTVYGSEDYQYLFYSVIFQVCLLFSGVWLCLQKVPIRLIPREMLLGMAIGGANLGATCCVIQILRELPSSIVFPTMSGGVIVLTAFVGLVRYQEKLTKTRFIGLVLTMVSLVFMNL